MQTHATVYCKYYKLQVLYTLFSHILGQMLISTQQNHSVAVTADRLFHTGVVRWNGILQATISFVVLVGSIMCLHIYLPVAVNHLQGRQWMAPCFKCLNSFHAHVTWTTSCNMPEYMKNFKVYMDLGNQSGQTQVNDGCLHTHIIFHTHTQLSLFSLKLMHPNNHQNYYTYREERDHTFMIRFNPWVRNQVRKVHKWSESNICKKKKKKS